MAGGVTTPTLWRWAARARVENRLLSNYEG